MKRMTQRQNQNPTLEWLFRRRLALLGGTTELEDCFIAMRYLLDSRQLIFGPEIEKYEKMFAEIIGVGHGCSFSSGRVGLYGLLRILGIGKGDEVLLQAPTHIVVANAIRYVGARPVYVDCHLDTYNIDLEDAERKITPYTKTIILQHTFGIPADINAALDLAGRNRLVVIEDCVHSLGAIYNGKKVGSFGKAAFFSTEETKIISTTMGGMVVTDDSKLAEKIKAFQQSCPPPSSSLTRRYILKLVLYHLLTKPYLHRITREIYDLIGKRQPLPTPTTGEEILGLRPRIYEQRLSNAQAAIGIRQLMRLEQNLSHRRRITEIYHDGLKDRVNNVFEVQANCIPSYVRYPLLVSNRQTIVEKMKAYLVVGTWFTSVLEEAVSPKCGDYPMGSCPRAEILSKNLINLPTHMRVRIQDAEIIVTKLLSAITN